MALYERIIIKAELVNNLLTKDLHLGHDPRHTKETPGGELKKAFWSFVWELGPTMFAILGVCFLGLGGILMAESSDDARYDDHLREVGKTATAEIVNVERVHVSGYRGSGHTDYTPTVKFEVNNIVYRTELDHYEVSSEPNFYRIGDRIQVRYDPTDPYTAGVKSTSEIGPDKFHEKFLGRFATGKRFLVAGLIMAFVGIPLGTAQLTTYAIKRHATRQTRRWAKLRRQVKSARRRARRGR